MRVTAQEVLDALREEWESLGSMSYHSYGFLWWADLTEEDITKLRVLLADAGSTIEAFGIAAAPEIGDKSGPEDGQSDTVPMKRPVMEGVDPAATDSGHVGASTYVWLIERGQAEHQEPTVWVTKTGPIAWTVNAYAAIRFQTREAAQAFVAEHLTHPTRGPSARAIQHGFSRPTGDKE